MDSQPLVVVDKCVISVLAKASLKMCVLRPNVLCCLETLVLQLIERHHIPRCSDYDQFEKICETLQQECGSFFNPCEKLFMEAQFLVRTPDVSENQLSFVADKLQRIFGLAHVSKVDPFIRRIERILLPDMPELAIQVFLQGAAHIQLANCSDGPNCTKLRMLDNQKAARASLIAAARADGFAHVFDGTNADDTGAYRPGMRALAELGVESPLRDAGLAKADIRELSSRLGLPTATKPSFACLMTRFQYGDRVDAERLRMVAEAELALIDEGFRQVRVRFHEGGVARIELGPGEASRLLEDGRAARVDERLRGVGFSFVTLDLGGYATGKMNAETEAALLREAGGGA